MGLRRSSFLSLCLAVCTSVGFARAPALKIIKGTGAQRGDFSHQVSLQSIAGKYFHFCGGSIIDETHILTAAHCIISEGPDKKAFRKKKEDIVVITGVISVLDRSEENSFTVDNIFTHESYRRTPAENDIAILKLTRAIPFNNFQKPIELPSTDTFGGVKVKASGWGRTRSFYGTEYVPGSVFLQQLDMQTIEQDKCREIYGSRIDDGEICVSGAAKTGTCNGDSGGPLTYGNQVIGVLSWGATLKRNKSCATQFPDVYTRVHHFLPWIQKVVWPQFLLI